MSYPRFGTENRPAWLAFWYTALVLLCTAELRGESAPSQDLQGAVPKVYFGFATTNLERLDAPSGALLIDRVTPEGPADRAGLRAGDQIVAFNGNTFRFANDAQAFRGLSWVEPDRPLRLTVLRSTQRLEVEMTPARASSQQIARNRQWLELAEQQDGRACLGDEGGRKACWREVRSRIEAAGGQAVIRIERLPGTSPQYRIASDDIEVPTDFDWEHEWPQFTGLISLLEPGDHLPIEIQMGEDGTHIKPARTGKRMEDFIVRAKERKPTR